MGKGSRTQPSLGALAVAAVLSGGCGSDIFLCSEDSQCGADGLCESNGGCSFPDVDCESGRRFGEHTPGGIGGDCVPLDEGTGSTTTTTSTSGTSTSLESGTEDSGTTQGIVGGSAGSSESTAGPPGGSSESGSTSVGGSSTGMPAGRVEDGQLVLYRFDEGSGVVVQDQSGVGEPADLVISGKGFAWEADGLRFDGGRPQTTIAEHAGPIAKVVTACLKSDAITLEAWVTPATALAEGPARIVTYSRNASSRNFSLMHGMDSELASEGWMLRLRTDETLADETVNGINGMPEFDLPITVDLEPTHVLVRHAADGLEEFFVDGAPEAEFDRPGAFVGGWETTDDYSFGVGNEFGFGNRSFAGVVHLVAIYCRALSDDEVTQNFDAGFWAGRNRAL